MGAGEGGKAGVYTPTPEFFWIDTDGNLRSAKVMTNGVTPNVVESVAQCADLQLQSDPKHA